MGLDKKDVKAPDIQFESQARLQMRIIFKQTNFLNCIHKITASAPRWDAQMFLCLTLLIDSSYGYKLGISVTSQEWDVKKRLEKAASFFLPIKVSFKGKLGTPAQNLTLCKKICQLATILYQASQVQRKKLQRFKIFLTLELQL